MTLYDLNGKSCTLCLTDVKTPLSIRLLAMGFFDGMSITPLCVNPGNTLVAFRVQNSIIALRRQDLAQIKIQ